jgi:hypothetical protein
MNKRTKYNVNSDKAPRTFNDIVFDSAVEMKFYRDVVLPQFKNGEISYFELQKKYELQPKFKSNGENIRAIDYVADFYLEFSDGRVEVVDIKGCPDSIALLKRRLFLYKYPDLPYKWICWSGIDGGWCDYFYVKKQRAVRKKEKSKSKS